MLRPGSHSLSPPTVLLMPCVFLARSWLLDPVADASLINMTDNCPCTGTLITGDEVGCDLGSTRSCTRLQILQLLMHSVHCSDATANRSVNADRYRCNAHKGSDHHRQPSSQHIPTLTPTVHAQVHIHVRGCIVIWILDWSRVAYVPCCTVLYMYTSRASLNYICSYIFLEYRPMLWP
jgi:hypothetical protein